MINYISLIYEFQYCFLPQRTLREKHVCFTTEKTEEGTARTIWEL